MISSKFIKSSFIYSVVGALPLASALFLLPFYTNLLSRNDFGVLALYISITYVIQILMNFGCDTYTGVYFFSYKDDKKKLSEFIGTIVTLLLFIGIFWILVFSALGNSIFHLIFKPSDNLEFYPFGFMTIITAFFNSFFKTYCNILVSQQRAVKFFYVNISNFILTITISLILLYAYPFSLIGPMWGRLLSGVGIFIIALFFFIKEFGIHFKSLLIKGFTNFCFPVLLFLILSWIISYIDRFIISNYLSQTDVGLFDFAVKCTMLIEFFQMGLGNSIMPKIFTLWKDGNLTKSTPEVNRYYNGFNALTLLLLPLFVIVVPYVIPIIKVNPDFYKSFCFLAILSIGFASRGLYLMFYNPIVFNNRTKVLPKVLFFSAVIQIVLTVFFIKNMGLIGAVWASFIAKIIQVFFLYLESRKIFQFKINIVKQIVLPSGYILMVILSEIFMIEEYRMFIQIAQLIIIFSLVLWVYRREIVLVLKQLLNTILPAAKSK